jgi:asparagine synthase (glutamine-hydrolysing)
MKRMHFRGPDAAGVWEGTGVLIGHRRLAILDLDSRSHQPMVSECGRYIITFNGEIYNFRSLRADLEARGVKFRTESDTEVILALFAAEGEAMLTRLRGMFAFVIVDNLAKRAFAARDPYGIKPLYYASTPTGVLIGSQVKALLATGEISAAPDARAQAGFWMLGNVPEPHTWYRDVHALRAGHCVWIESGRIGQPRCWWDITAAWRDAPDARVRPEEVRERVSAALRASVAAHLVADVPVGVFLSGGIDSGALAGLMVDCGARNVQGVTIAFSEFMGTGADEVPRASSVAKLYGIHQHVRVITSGEFSRDLPSILDAMDQPSIDGVNTWYASKAAAELGLKVVVSGVGGDELFQGYSLFRELPPLVSAWRPFSRIPGVMALARLLAKVQADRSRNSRWRYLPDWSRSMPGAWLSRRGLFSPSDLPTLMGDALASEALKDFDPHAWIAGMRGLPADDLRLELSQIESTTYLRNQLLRDSDWASMAHSIELRTPLVDAWLLRDLTPLLSTFKRFPGKSLLARAASHDLPSEVATGRKTGFGIPVRRWLTHTDASASAGGDSRAWARQLTATYQSAMAAACPVD